jgi:hypothetical protein
MKLPSLSAFTRRKPFPPKEVAFAILPVLARRLLPNTSSLFEEGDVRIETAYHCCPRVPNMVTAAVPIPTKVSQTNKFETQLGRCARGQPETAGES